MFHPCPSSRFLVSGSALAALLSTTMLVFPAWSQTVTPVDPALRDVVRAAYVRAGQVKTDAEIGTLAADARPFVRFEPSRATEADIVGLVGRLGLTDASLPPPAAPVSPTRILSTDPLPDYDGATDLTGKSASELGAMLSRGETTSREIVLQYLYKIQRLDHAGPALRSVTELNPELLSIADQMDARRAAATAAGETLPPLFGIPILVKNNIDTADAMRTTASSLALFGSKPTQDAALIQQLRDQGAIIMGKANMSEWANFRFGMPAISPDGGVVLNPLDPSLTASGSSSGSAVAAAMHFAPITIGTETNGSLIGPATTHHVWSLKTTTGLVSRTGIIPGLEMIDTPGPMANTVVDLALIMNAMKGADPADPLNAAYTGDRTADFTQKLDGDLAGVRIGVRVTSSQIDGLVKSLASRSNATIVAFTQDDESAAMQRSIASLSDTDLEVFYNRVTKNTLPSDAPGRTAVLDDYRSNLDGLSGATALSYFGFSQSISTDYVMRKYIDRYLAARVSNPEDYDSAVIRLMGELFKPLSSDTEQYAKNLNDVVESNKLNRSVLEGLFWVLQFLGEDGIDTAAAKTPEQFASDLGYASEAEFDAAIENWKRITTLVLNGARRELGVDVTATDRLGTNFDFNTSAYGSTPNLAVPVGSGTGPAELVLSADNFQDELLLRVGYALDQALSTPEFANVRALAPNPPAIGFGNGSTDIGPLLPLVLNDLDDKGRATKAHLLTTQMAPIVLRTTDPSKIPEFDGRISGNGGLIKQSAGVQLLTGTSDFSGNVQVWQGGLAIDKTEALGTSANTVTLEAGSALIATKSFALGRDVILRNGGALGVLDGAILVEDGTVSGNGGLTKTGGGQLTLAGANSYTGGTNIQAGTVAVASEQNLGQAFGAVTIGDNAVLSATAGFTTTRPMTLAGSSGLAVAAGSTLSATNTVSGIGGLSKLGAGTLALSGENTYTGGTWLLGGVVSASRDANLGATTGGLGFGGGQLATTASFTSTRLASLATAGGIDVAQGTVFGMGGAITGSGSLFKLGAGTLSLSGENSYTGGTVLLNGTLQASGGAALFDAGRVDVAAPARLSLSSSETIGALSGSGAVDLGTSRLSVGADGSSSLYEGTIGGTGGLTKLGAGRLNLTGTSAYSGPTVVEGGLLSANGVLSGSKVEVANGGTLGGSGRIDALTVDSGATLAPGNSVGILTVDHDAVFNAGSIFRVEVASDGRMDKLIVGGTAFLGGVQVELLKENTTEFLSGYDRGLLGTSFQFITAAGGINGTFGPVKTDFIFLGGDISYDAGGVTLTVERNGVAFASFARSDNARAAAGALDAMVPGTPLYEQVIAGNRPDVLPPFFESLTGEIHADMSSTIIGDSRFLREAALARAGTGATGDPSAGAVPIVGDASGATVAFFQGFGSWGSTDGRDGGSTERSTGGFFTGLDGTLDGTWRIGALAGYSSASLDAAGPAGSGSVDSYQVALYGGRQWGGLGVRAGLGYGHNEIETSRSVNLFGTGLQPLSSDDSADMGQAFGEVGYRLGTERLSLEPFANIAYIALRTDGFAETDGSASLRAEAFTQDATFSTLGLAASTRIETGSVAVTARASIGWLHSFGDATPEARLAFSAGGPAFDVRGTPIANDALVFDAGASVDVRKDVSLDLAYRGQFAQDVADNGFRAGLSWKF